MDTELIVGETLTPKQEKFCRFYTQNSELFGNATLAYAEAYEFNLDTLDHTNATEIVDDRTREIPHSSEYDKAYNVCAANASRMLKTAKVNKRVAELLNEVLTDEVVDAELAKIILSKYDHTAKLSAIREYNKLKQRIVERTDLTSGGKPIIQLANEVAQRNGINAVSTPDS